jgi:hypothetical protein
MLAPELAPDGAGQVVINRIVASVRLHVIRRKQH